MNFLEFLQLYRNPTFSYLLNILVTIFNDGLLAYSLTWLYWCSNKDLSKFIAQSFFFSSITIQSIKIIIRIPRPWIIDPNINPDPVAINGATGYSCPSGHTQTATSIGVAYGLSIKRKIIKLLFFIAPLIVAFSRMYYGVHSPLDVSIAFTCALIITIFNFFYNKNNHNNLHIYLIIGSLFALLLALYQITFNSVPIEFAFDSIKSSGISLGFGLGLLLDSKYLNFSTVKNHKIPTFIFGVLGTALIYSTKYLISKYSLVNIIIYFLIGLWISWLYPYLFTKFKKDKTC